MTGFLVNHATYAKQLLILAGYAGHIALWAALTWAAYFAGRLVTRYIFRQESVYWEIELAVGFVAFGLTTLALGAAHLLYPWVVRGIVLALLALSAPLAWRRGREAGSFLREKAAGVSNGTWVLVVFLTPLVGSMLLQSMLPPFEWDSLVYHLYIPKVYAETHHLVYLPRLAYSSMPLGGEMIFTWGYLWDGLAGAAAMAPIINGLMAVITWRIARRYLDNFWATAAAAFLVVTPLYSIYFGSAYVDMLVGAFALMAFALYLRGLKGAGDAALAGFFLGAAMGVKYTGVYGAIALTPIMAWDVIRRRLPFRRVALVLVVAFVVVAPWLLKAYIERGNPVFPAMYDVFGGRDLSPETAEYLVKWQASIGMGREFADYLQLPYRLSVEAAGGYERFDGVILPFSFVCLLLAVAFFRRGKLIVYTVLYVAAWSLIASQQLRFISAAMGTFAIISAGVFAHAAGAFKRRWVRNAVTVLLVGGPIIFNYAIIAKTTYYVTAYGVETLVPAEPEVFLERLANPYPVDRYINENLPEDAVILMIFENHLLYLEREAIYDSFFEASGTLTAVSELENPAAVADYVESLGATYILTGRFGAPAFWKYYEPATRNLWITYLDGYTTVIFNTVDFELRVINPR
jgi:hypothetical protein